MLEKCRLSKDKSDSFRALLTVLSKVFDCLWHELLIAKLTAYGSSRCALKFNFLIGRKEVN